MKDTTSQLLYNTGFLLVLSFIIAMGVLSYLNMKQMIESDKWETHTYVIIEKLEELFSELKDAETEQLGFIITGKDEYLHPYNNAIRKINFLFADLKALTRDSPVQQSRINNIETLVKKKLAELSETIDLRKEKGFDAASRVVATNRGLAITDSISKKIADVQNQETGVLQESIQSKAAFTHKLNISIAIGGILSFILLSTILLLLKRENTRRAEVEKQLRLHQEHLNETVEKRTHELKTSEQRWATTLASIGDAVIATDDAQNVTFMNSVAEYLTGYTMQDALGKPVQEIFNIVNEKLNTPIEDLSAKILQEGVVANLNDTILEGKNGTKVPIDNSAAPIRGEDGRIGGVVLVFRDIQNRKKVEMDRAQLAAIVEHSDDAIFSKTLDGIITSWNAGASKMYGYTQEDIKGKPVSILIPPGHFDDIPSILQKIKFGELIHDFDTIRMRKDGKLIPVSLTVSPIKDSSGAISGASTIARDITERKRLERDLKKRVDDLANVNKELETFSYSVAHDLRGPLRTLNGFSSLLFEDYSDKLDDDGKDYLSRIKKSTDKMNELIDDLLSLSKITQQEMRHQDVDLSALAFEIINDFKESNPDRIINISITKNMRLQGDEKLLRIALQNLLRNAWKYTGKTPDPYIEFGAFEKEDEVIYFIKDNGAGFDMKQSDKLFVPFKRLHSDNEFPGSGIGLAIVDRVIKRHGGRIWAEGEVGKGAIFYFTISR